MFTVFLLLSTRRRFRPVPAAAIAPKGLSARGSRNLAADQDDACEDPVQIQCYGLLSPAAKIPNPVDERRAGRKRVKGQTWKLQAVVCGSWVGAGQIRTAKPGATHVIAAVACGSWAGRARSARKAGEDLQLPSKIDLGVVFPPPTDTTRIGGFRPPHPPMNTSPPRLRAGDDVQRQRTDGPPGIRRPRPTRAFHSVHIVYQGSKSQPTTL